MKKFITIICVCFVMSSVAQNTAKDDKLLQIMQTELNRNIQQLQKEKIPVYLLSYRIEEIQEQSMSSNFGALSDTGKTWERKLTIQVRVGGKEMDNYQEKRKPDYSEEGFSIGVLVQVSLSDDSKSIQQTLWRETENAYRAAVKKYEHIKTSKSLLVDKEDKSPDYSDADVAQYYEKPLNFSDLNFNVKQWEEKVKAYSAFFIDEKRLLKGSASFNVLLERKYYVNSEGTAIVQNYTAARLFVSAQTQADDGMELPMYKSYFAHLPSGLPDDSTVINDIRIIIQKLMAMRSAPIVDAYNGPAILSKEAAGVFFHEIFGHRVEGYRLKKETDAQTYKKKVNEEILHPDISVIFDPTIKEYKGNPLNGTYQYDDEGVKGEKVLVVDRGVLKDFLMTRTPIEGFPKSNGHARASSNHQPVSRQSNLIVETAHPYTDKELREMLIQEAKKQGKSYGYRFEQVRGGFTLTGRYLPNSFNVTPIEVYRVYVDGRPDEMVRGVDLVGTPLAMFSQVEALGDTPGNFAGTCGAESGSIQAGCCSPALFVKLIETQRKEKNQDIAPLFERPYQQQVNIQPNDFSTIAFKAMEDEMKRSMELKLDSFQTPYFISYLISDANEIRVNSSLGGIIESRQSPSRNQTTAVLVGDMLRNNLNYSNSDIDEFSSWDNNYDFSIENDYNAIRKSLWKSTDEQYKKAVQTLESKKTAIQQQNLPEEEKNLADFSAVPVITKIIEKQKETILLSDVENLAKELSLVFEKYPQFINSNVCVNIFQADALYLNSEGIKYKQPVSLVKIFASASVRADDGEVLEDNVVIYTNTFNQLPEKETLKNQINEMASLLEALSKAPIVNDIYKGPVMFDGDAVGFVVSQSFFGNTHGLIAKRKKIVSVSSSFDLFALFGGGNDKENKYEMQIEKQIIDKNISLTAIDKTTMFENQPLIGAYEIDADGVMVEDKLPLIVDGTLKTLLNDRIPTQKISQSNGHKRFTIDDYSLMLSVGPGVVEMTSKKTTDVDKMKKQLIALAKKKELEYAYIIRKIGDISFISDDLVSSASRIASGFNSVKPFYIYKVSVKDGSETLVRMATMANLNLESFKEVASFANQQQVCNMMLSGGSLGGIFSSLFSDENSMPCSLILPKALILNDVEIKKDNGTVFQKEAVTPNPLEK